MPIFILLNLSNDLWTTPPQALLKSIACFAFGRMTNSTLRTHAQMLNQATDASVQATRLRKRRAFHTRVLLFHHGVLAANFYPLNSKSIRLPRTEGLNNDQVNDWPPIPKVSCPIRVSPHSFGTLSHHNPRPCSKAVASKFRGVLLISDDLPGGVCVRIQKKCSLALSSCPSTQPPTIIPLI